jgi:hypothetical protein
VTIRVFDPSVEMNVERTVRKTVSHSLDGMRVAVLNNGWRSMDLMSRTFAKYFPERYGVAAVREWRIPTSNETPAALLEEVVATSDVAIVGLAN